MIDLFLTNYLLNVQDVDNSLHHEESRMHHLFCVHTYSTFAPYPGKQNGTRDFQCAAHTRGAECFQHQTSDIFILQNKNNLAAHHPHRKKLSIKICNGSR